VDPKCRNPRAVREMFEQIAPRYDFLNHLLSLGVDCRWRRAAARAALAKGPRRVLDVATGTGDLAIFLKRLRPEAEVVGLDFAPEMLKRAEQKARRVGVPIALVEGDALAMPFEDGSFDALTVAFGFRNFADYERGLREFYRVLAPGGRAVILEFPPPPERGFGRLVRFYYHRVLPRLGGWISGSPEAYRYLPETVERFPKPERMREMLAAAGFSPQVRLLTGGLAGLFIGDKRG